MKKEVVTDIAAANRSRLRLGPRTIRARLAFFYFGAVTLSGALLLAATVGYWQGATGAQSSAVPANGPNDPLAGPGFVGGSQIDQHSSDSHQLLVAAGVALGLMVALSIVFGWVAAGRVLRPLRTITGATKRISATNLHERLNLVGPDDELKELGDTFDELLERLDRSFQLERQFVANASHELRTPLATMRASLEVAMAKPGPPAPQMGTLAGRLGRELDQIDRLLESFLTLAQAQRGEVVDETLVALDSAASSAIERRSAAIALLRLRVEQDCCPYAWALGSQTLLGRLVDNLVDNAVTHNEPGGWVRVRTAVDGEVSRLVVENGGAFLDQEGVEALARPFQRLGAQRTGSDKGMGLGLSIVKSIAEAHRGRLELHTRDGGGLYAAVELPRAERRPVGATA